MNEIVILEMYLYTDVIKKYNHMIQFYFSWLVKDEMKGRFCFTLQRVVLQDVLLVTMFRLP